LAQMGAAMRRMAVQDAAERILADCMALMKKNP
jgi:hypothetical protein